MLHLFGRFVETEDFTTTSPQLPGYLPNKPFLLLPFLLLFSRVAFLFSIDFRELLLL